MNVSYRTADVDGMKVFYREAGAIDAPTVLLLHGFPASSHMYRNLIPALADRYHLVAPDLPGFGFSGAPDREQFKYTFDNLTKVVDRFTSSITARRLASASLSRILSGSPPSSRKTATPTLKV